MLFPLLFKAQQDELSCSLPILMQVLKARAQSAMIPVKKTAKDEWILHLSLLHMLSNGFKTYFGISDMIMICGIHLHRTCKKLSKTKDIKF